MELIYKKAEMWPVMLTPFTETCRIDIGALNALVDWYIANGSDGLFAVCLSSEMYELSDNERFMIADHVVKKSNSIPVAATGTFGGNINCQIEYVKRMFDIGVSIVVLIPSQLVSEDDSETILLDRLYKILESTGNIPLGVYECPSPYHRVLSPHIIKLLAETGRFEFYKDTSCSMKFLDPKINAASGSSIKYLNANSPTLLSSLIAGGGGYAGIGANMLPWHYSWLCHNYADHPETAKQMQRFLGIADMVVRNKYPSVAKIFLSMNGLPINPITRSGNPSFSDEEIQILKYLYEYSNIIKQDI